MKGKLSKIILLGYIIINILIPISVSAESLKSGNFEKLSIDEGLSNEYVTSIFQDSKGYMWIGTIDGLNRYDGERIKVYNCSVDRENSLSSTYINAIEEDSRGNIWVGTDLGLDIIDRNTDRIVRFNDLKIDGPKLSNLKITSLLKDDKDDIMWVGTENGLIKIDIKNSKFEALYHDKNDKKSLTNSYITCLKNDENDTLLVGTTCGINLINKKNLEINYFEGKVYDNSLYVYNIEFDYLGNAWISTKEGIFIYNQKEDKKNELYIIDDTEVKVFNIKENKINSIYIEKDKDKKIYNNEFILNDSNNNIWISSSNGIKIYSIRNKKISYLNKNTTFVNNLASNNITCFYEDSNGTIWVGTDKGINIANKGNQFNFNTEYNHKKGTLYDKSIVSMIQHNRYYLMATKYYGIYIFDEKDGSLVDIICQNNDNKVDLNNEYITGLYKIDEDDILVVTNKYAILVNINNGIFTKRSYEDIYHEELNYLYSDGEFAWSSNTSDFRSVNIKTEEKTSYGEDLKKFNINPGKITYILPDYEDENILWLGGSGTGLVKYHKKRGVIKQYTHDSLNRNSLISNDINCMIFDKFENLWIGTNIGLSKFNIKTNKFTSYTTAEGLTNNFINSILLDDDNNLWISTNKGLNKFDIEKENIINFTKMDGIHGYQFNINSSLKNKDGMMIFGSTNGITYFNPEDIENPIGNKNKVVFGDIFIGKNKVSYNNKELILEHYDKDLSIEYFLPIYENLNNITYEYMIEGIDSNWIYVDRKSYLNIKTLEPGKYTLKMRARDGHGNLTKETSMNIRVKSPIWKTPLAYLIYIVILLAIAFYIFNYVKILQNLVNHKTMKLNKQLEENKKLSEEIINNEKFKNNYFVNLSHELRTPINVITSILQLTDNMMRNKTMTYKKAEGYIEIINRNCENLLKIINDIIEENLKKLSYLEVEKRFSSIDEIAHPFSEIVGKILNLYPEEFEGDSEEIRGNLYELGYSLGKWIYIIDALDDLKEDMEKNKFNPLY